MHKVYYTLVFENLLIKLTAIYNIWMMCLKETTNYKIKNIFSTQFILNNEYHSQ